LYRQQETVWAEFLNEAHPLPVDGLNDLFDDFLCRGVVRSPDDARYDVRPLSTQTRGAAAPVALAAVGFAARGLPVAASGFAAIARAGARFASRARPATGF
jgi:hypothetical protein